MDDSYRIESALKLQHTHTLSMKMHKYASRINGQLLNSIGCKFAGSKNQLRSLNLGSRINVRQSSSVTLCGNSSETASRVAGRVGHSPAVGRVRQYSFLSSMGVNGHQHFHNLRGLNFIRSYVPAFVFDIDGVLLKGNKPLASAKEALDLLDSKSIPYVFMTNGGGSTESKRMEFLSGQLRVKLSPLQLVQSHTPFKALSNLYDRVLVVGGVGQNARECALEYGFTDVVMPIDLVFQNPLVLPHHRYTQDELATWARPLDLSKPIQAVLVFNDPRDMSTDLQIVMDILNSQDGLIGTKRNPYNLISPEKPAVPIVFSNNDFVWANNYPLPRYGQGAFRLAIEALYRETNREHLSSTIMGKPFEIQYDFTHHVLIDWREKLLSGNLGGSQVLPELGTAPSSSPFTDIYMVGDNPESDIKGAVDNGWKSILVRTGVYRDEDWDEIIARPSEGVFDDVLAGVRSVVEHNEKRKWRRH